MLKQNYLLLILIIVFPILHCQAQIFSPGIGTYNQISHTSCKKNKLGLCTGKIFKLNCQNFHDTVSDPNNIFLNKSDVSIIANLDCTAKDYFIFEELEKNTEKKYDFLKDTLSASKIIPYKYDYIKFTYKNTGEVFEFPKEPKIAYVEYEKSSASPVSSSEKNTVRNFIVFEKNKSATNNIKIVSKDEVLYVY